MTDWYTRQEQWEKTSESGCGST